MTSPEENNEAVRGLIQAKTGNGLTTATPQVISNAILMALLRLVTIVAIFFQVVYYIWCCRFIKHRAFPTGLKELKTRITFSVPSESTFHLLSNVQGMVIFRSLLCSTV